MKEIIFVGAGGFIGASIRYMISLWLVRFSQYSFPLGTFLVNIIGCLAIGFFMGVGFDKYTAIPFKEFVIIGMLGGFTTFSAFGLESFEMLQSNQFKTFYIYVLGSIIFGLMSIRLGIAISQ